jgi:hypothetical protein
MSGLCTKIHLRRAGQDYYLSPITCDVTETRQRRVHVSARVCRDMCKDARDIFVRDFSSILAHIPAYPGRYTNSALSRHITPWFACVLASTETNVPPLWVRDLCACSPMLSISSPTSTRPSIAADPLGFRLPCVLLDEFCGRAWGGHGLKF